VESKLGEGSTFWFEMRVEETGHGEGDGLSEDTSVDTTYLPTDSADRVGKTDT
jgi:hypothetical protein